MLIFMRKIAAHYSFVSPIRAKPQVEADGATIQSGKNGYGPACGRRRHSGDSRYQAHMELLRVRKDGRPGVKWQCEGLLRKETAQTTA